LAFGLVLDKSSPLLFSPWNRDVSLALRWHWQAGSTP